MGDTLREIAAARRGWGEAGYLTGFSGVRGLRTNPGIVVGDGIGGAGELRVKCGVYRRVGDTGIDGYIDGPRTWTGVLIGTIWLNIRDSRRGSRSVRPVLERSICSVLGRFGLGRRDIASQSSEIDNTVIYRAGVDPKSK